MGKIYGCVKPLYEGENLDKQIKAIKAAYPGAEIRQEFYTFGSLDTEINKGDTLVFDSIIRISSKASDAFMIYNKIHTSGGEIVILQEPFLNTELRKRADVTDTPILMRFIMVQFADAHSRVLEAFRQSRERAKGYKRRGGVKGRILNVKKKKPAMDYIKKHSRMFEGIEYDRDIMGDLKISPNTYYRYKKELKKEYLNSKK